MQGQEFTITLNYPGALTGDQDPYWIMRADCKLVHISAQCITQDAIIFLADDGTQITDTITVTAGVTPVVADLDEMLNDTYPHILAGSVLHLDIDNGSNCVDLIVVLTFLPG